jgi:molybdate transport system substrate-binding protein
MRVIGVVTAAILAFSATAHAAEVKILTTGAMKEVVLAVVPAFERETGHKAVVANDTAGGLVRRNRWRNVGVGVVVKEGAAVPDISTVEAFKNALKAAKSVAYIDPAAGGSSGIYVSGLLDKLGIAADVKPKAKLKQGGYVAELIANGEAELGLHQISEILPVKGVKLVGPLPAEIQNYTTYAAAVGAQAQQKDAAQAMLKLLAGPEAEGVLKARGMERPPA